MYSYTSSPGEIALPLLTGKSWKCNLSFTSNQSGMCVCVCIRTRVCVSWRHRALGVVLDLSLCSTVCYRDLTILSRSATVCVCLLCTGPSCYSGHGRGYNGTVNVTRYNTSCQRWDRNYPHRHLLEFEDYPEIEGGHNFCRNPGERGAKPWCFTIDPGRRWDYCDIPECGELCRDLQFLIAHYFIDCPGCLWATLISVL